MFDGILSQELYKVDGNSQVNTSIAAKTEVNIACTLDESVHYSAIYCHNAIVRLKRKQQRANTLNDLLGTFALYSDQYLVPKICLLTVFYRNVT